MNTYLKLFVDCLDKYQKLNDTEFGRLIRAALRYKANGEEVNLTGREELLWDGLKLDIDRDNKKYDELKKSNKINGFKGGRPKTTSLEEKNQTVFTETENNRTVFLETEKSQEEDKEEDKEKDKDKDKEKDKNNLKEFGADAPPLAEKSNKIIKNKHGEYGWVKLSEAEYQRLITEYGEETVKLYISVVDESAQQTGNKNKWKDWNLTVRKAIRDKWGHGYNVKNQDQQEVFNRYGV